MRDEKTARRREELAEKAVVANEPKIKVGRDGKEYQVAAIIDPTVNKDYVEATDATGLEVVGSKEWIKAKQDRGEQYVG